MKLKLNLKSYFLSRRWLKVYKNNYHFCWIIITIYFLYIYPQVGKCWKWQTISFQLFTKFSEKSSGGIIFWWKKSSFIIFPNIFKWMGNKNGVIHVYISYLWIFVNNDGTEFHLVRASYRDSWRTNQRNYS